MSKGRKLILGYQHQAVVPSSTENIIVFPVDRVKGRFNLDFYDPAMTKGRISREEIARFMHVLDPMVKPIFRTKMSLFLKCYQNVYPFLLLAVTIGFIIGLVMGFRSGSFNALFIPPLAFGLELLSLVIIMAINFVHIASVKKKLKDSKAKIKPIVAARNREFRRKGFFWVVPYDFPYWIELWKGGALQMSMEEQYGIPMREQVSHYYPASKSKQIHPMYYGAV